MKNYGFAALWIVSGLLAILLTQTSNLGIGILMALLLVIAGSLALITHYQISREGWFKIVWFTGIAIEILALLVSGITIIVQIFPLLFEPLDRPGSNPLGEVFSLLGSIPVIAVGIHILIGLQNAIYSLIGRAIIPAFKPVSPLVEGSAEPQLDTLAEERSKKLNEELLKLPS